MEPSVVYFTKHITPASLERVYDALGCDLRGRVAVKLSSGEPGGHNFLQPALIAGLVRRLNGTIVECNTAYGGARDEAASHHAALREHGFADVAPCRILDEEGEMQLPIGGGKHMDGYNVVGKGLADFDSLLILSHFKGHMMGGFGGALKNMSIGLASRNGKARIHSVGRTASPEACWDYTQDQDGFLECMAEACSAVIRYVKPENIAYISVANRLSVDCDCDSNPHEPEMADLGIFASLDPVALDRCCYDAVHASPDPGKAALIERMESRHAIHTVEWAAHLGLGNNAYRVVRLED